MVVGNTIALESAASPTGESGSVANNRKNIRLTVYGHTIIMIMRLSVANQDLGKGIGLNGKNMAAIRAIIGAAAARQKNRLSPN